MAAPPLIAHKAEAGPSRPQGPGGTALQGALHLMVGQSVLREG